MTDMRANLGTVENGLIRQNRSTVWYAAALLMVFLLALFLRLHQIGGPFASGDDVETAWSVSFHYPRQRLIPASGNTLETTPLRLLTLPHGFLNAAIALVFVSLCSILSLDITEAVWHFPFGVLGAATVLVTYALVNLVAEKRAAVLAALLIAVSPFHVAYSRTSGVSHHVLAYLLQSLSLFLYLRFFCGARQPRNQLAASMALALCVTTDFGFPVTIIIIGCAGVICYYQAHGGFAVAYQSLLRDLRKWRLVLPVLLSVELVFLEFLVPLVLFGFPLGIWGRAFASPKAFGLHFEEYLRTLIFLTNPVVWIVVVPCLVLSVKYFRPLDRKAVFLIWGVLYSIPFLIIARGLFTYHITIIGALLIVTSVVLFDLPFTRRDRAVVVGSIIGFLVTSALLMTTLSLKWGVPVPGLLAHEPNQGSVREENGAKAAGWWIRKMVPDADYIYTDAYGGAGLEPPVAWYYFHKLVLTLSDASKEEILALLDATREQIDVLVIRSETLPALEARDYVEFRLAVEIVSGDYPLLYIFVRDWPDPPTRLDTAEGNQLYDQEFAKLEHIIDMSWFRY